MIVLLLAWRIAAHFWLLEIVPAVARKLVEQAILKLFDKARKVKPMDPRKAKLGKPFIGEAHCEDMDCGKRWTVVQPNGLHPHIDLECPDCGQLTGTLV